MAYLLDTGVLVEVLRAAPNHALVRRLSQVPPEQRWTSAVAVSQVLLSARIERNPRLMQDVIRLVAAIRVAPYDLAAAQAFAKLRATGTAQETDDLMMAAIAVSRGWALVTRRRDVFAGLEGLRLDDWMV